MLGLFRKRVINTEYQQLRLRHKLRGKPPIYARTLQQRIDEMNYKDELYTTRIDIGFPRPIKNTSKFRKEHMEHLKKIRSDSNLEQLAREHKLVIDLNEVKDEWLQSRGPLHKKRIADHYGIYEHLYGEGYFTPYLNLNIHYEQNNDTLIPVYYGNIIKPSEAKNPPTVDFESDRQSLWTLVLTNLDGHMTENDKEYIHWMLTNIPGNILEKGETIVEYLQPFPLKGTGYHRYVFVLYQQDGPISYDIKKVSQSSPLADRTFVTRDWYQKFQDHITPTALAFYQCDWDSSLKDFFHNTLKMKEPVYEYDFPPPYMRPQEWFPRRKPFNLYMDKYRDPKQINKEYLLLKLKDEKPFQKPEPPLRFPNAQRLPQSMPSWLKLHVRKIRNRWGRINEV